MSETIGVNILKRAREMEVSPQFDGYAGVRIFVGTDDDGNAIVVESGNTDGRTLEIKNPLGTQEMADNILADIQGYQYQPLSATGALLNPAAEMGDGVTVNGVYSGIFVRATQFGRLMASDIAAPTDEEIEHEFAIEDASDRQYTRFVQQTKASLKITNQAITAEVSARTAADNAINATLSVQATQIAARVTKTGGNNSSFGWVLNDSSHTWYSGNQMVMRVNSSGLEVKGKVTATTGSIGGFAINSSDIRYNNQGWNGTNTTGIYIGVNGIQLGSKNGNYFQVTNQGVISTKNFSVNSSGDVQANNIRLTGTLYLRDGSSWKTITAANMYTGAYQASQNYSTWNTGSGYGYNYNSATTYGTDSYPSWFRCGALRADAMYFGTATLGTNSKTFKDGDGNNVTINYVSYSTYG